MKRFFTKKSVAIIFTVIMLAGFFSFNFASAQTKPVAPTPPQWINYNVDPIQRYYYQYPTPVGWHNMTDGKGTLLSDAQITALGLTGAANISATYRTQVDTYLQTTGVTAADLAAANNSWAQNVGNAGSSLLASGLKNIGNYAAGIIGFAQTGPILAALTVIQMVASALVAMAGYLLDKAIFFTIINIKDFFSSTGPVTTIWTMLRDMINITFIFILLYEAIAKIIGSWGVKAKTTLINIIISAIFINFSMLIAKILIDAGNMVALQIYQPVLDTGFTVSNFIFTGLGVLSFVKSALSITGQFNMLLSLLLQITLSVILIYAFLMGAFMLIGRAVMLVFYVMVSPIGFIGSSVPGLGKFTNDWWDGFIDQILVAPALMFVLLITVKLLQNNFLQNLVTASSQANSLAAAAAPPSIDVSGFFYYALVIMFLIKGMGYVKKLSGEIAGTIVKVATVVAVGAAAVVTGGAAIGLAGSTLGKAAISSAGNLAGKAASSKWGTRLALTAKDMGTKVAASGVGKGVGQAAGQVKKFATNEYVKSGAVGLAQMYVRDKIMGGVKTATGGVVDLKAVEKMMEESTKGAKKNLEKQANSITKPSTEESIRLSKIKISTENAGIKEANDLPKSQEYKNSEEYLNKKLEDKAAAEKIVVEKEKAVKESAEKLANVPAGITPAVEKVRDEARFAHTEAKKELDKATTESNIATTDFSKAEAAVQAFQKKYTDAQRVIIKNAQDEMAKSFGITGGIVGVEMAIKENIVVMNEALQKKDKFIIDEIKNGNYWGTLLFGKDREKFSEELRAGTYKSEDETEKLLKKLIKMKESDEKKNDKPENPVTK